MENVDMIAKLISSVGFPIVCVLIIGYLFIEEQKDHKEETNALKEAIVGNTLIMTELKQLLTDMRGGD